MKRWRLLPFALALFAGPTVATGQDNSLHTAVLQRLVLQADSEMRDTIMASIDTNLGADGSRDVWITIEERNRILPDSQQYNSVVLVCTAPVVFNEWTAAARQALAGGAATSGAMWCNTNRVRASLEIARDDSAGKPGYFEVWAQRVDPDHDMAEILAVLPRARGAVFVDAMRQANAFLSRALRPPAR